MVHLTDEGFSEICECGVETRYMRLEVASRKAGLHPQSLQRANRNSAIAPSDRIGKQLGRTLFFTEDDLEKLGYLPKNEETNA